MEMGIARCFVSVCENGSLFQALSYHLPSKQSFCDSPGFTQARQQVEESKFHAAQKAQFLAASAPHSGD